ncbi:response regulator transcription factor [Desulfogranum marinum]|uniref:response regulator transcription factor n=1 Tax=Desulfogranum marinum TaxID=453220 RepID=UPI0029C6985E|nr:response regulator transcription factor [Desulfogranum marinum]
MFLILCSSNAPIRERWEKILSQKYTVYEATNIEALRQLSAEYKKEGTIILADSNFSPLKNLLEAWAVDTQPKLFFLSLKPQEEEGISLLQGGAVGYANSYIAEPLLLKAVDTIEKGKVWVGQSLMLSLIQHTSQTKKKGKRLGGLPLEGISAREQEIIELIAQGMSNKAIASQLFISERTVKSHLTSIFKKTGTSSRLQVAILCEK